ncbi:hypothetical protein B1757_02495 [Acidithiobacillus marinus]|uniref:Disulfide bond formation protein B n=1 Tax=Acidithiobacillus marinus TaxID=187490 RepID=A0A2I1DPT5_9PROT|nr:disulfide bond formation protein B [Acidithiobacillus marinus]PKY11849.1 hypothetical protein B1757_02495 [Acidithiobacillus marinus]
MSTRNLAGSFTSLGSTLAAVVSASAGACAGGVCLAGAQAGISTFSASATSFSAFAAASSAAEGAAEVSGSLTQSAFPWWMRLAVAALILSTIYTAVILSRHPAGIRLAILSALGGTLAVIAELHWLPVGKSGELLAIAVGVTPLVLGPLLIRWQGFFARIQWGILLTTSTLAAIALIWVFALQFFQALEPCALCWVERFAIAGIILSSPVTWIQRTRGIYLAFGSAVVGLVAVFAQLAEIHHAAHAVAGFCSLFSHTSCAVAGSQLLGPWPIALDAGVFFAVILALVQIAWRVSPEESK